MTAVGCRSFDRCTGVLTLVAGVPSKAVGAAFLAVGLVAAAGTYAVVRNIRRRRGQPRHECRPVAVIDRKLGLATAGGGAVVLLDQVRFARKPYSDRAHQNSSR